MKKSKSGTQCVAFGCNNRRGEDDNISFHSFPSDNDLRSKWINALKRKNFTPSKHSRLCSCHFLSEDYIPASERFSSSKSC